MSAELELARPVDADVAADIAKESVFVSPNIDRITVSEDGTKATVHMTDTADLDAIMDKAARFLEVMVKQVSGFDAKVFFENERIDSGPYEEDVNVGLVERGWVHEYGKGQIAMRGPVLKLVQYLNDKAADFYFRELEATDGHFPALIDADTLHKCGYFDSHPNIATFVGNVVEDFDAIEEFRLANSCAEHAVMPAREHIHMDGMCLNPAACFPAYPTLTGKRYETGECFTWMGRVFRYESRNISGLDRLYEFNVRELVFVGTMDYVTDVRRRVLPFIQQLAECLDIDCALQTATDPFFATVSAAKKFWQAAQEVKNEIKIPVLDADGNKKAIACGSVNLHGNFFGKAFDIRDTSGEPVVTGCVGLGIERWVLAAFTQHGLDPDRWPADVRGAIFD